MLLAAVVAGVAALAGLSYWRAGPDDPGLTTEVALVLTTLLGALAMSHPELAAGIGVVVAALLHSREKIHGFVRSALTEDELRDAIIFAGATLVVLPLLPDEPLDPYGVFNLRLVWIVVILVMAVSGAGYIAIRLLGVRFGLPLSGFAGGFVSSSATIGAMAARVKQAPDLLRPAAAGAVLSTVATIVELALLLAATSMAALAALAVPLACAGVVAVLYGGLFTLWALKHEGSGDEKPGRAFSLVTALGARRDPGGHPRCLGGAAGLAGRSRHRHRRRRGGLRRRPFGRRIGRVAGGRAEDDRSAGRLPGAGGAHHQHRNEGRARLHRWQPRLRVSRSCRVCCWSWPRPGRAPSLCRRRDDGDQRLASRSISTIAPRARPVTPMQVRAGRRSAGK